MVVYSSDRYIHQQLYYRLKELCNSRWLMSDEGSLIRCGCGFSIYTADVTDQFISPDIHMNHATLLELKNGNRNPV